MNEHLAARLELTRARARALLGSADEAKRLGPQESSQDGPRGPSGEDAKKIAARIHVEMGMESEQALTLARAIVEQARTALGKQDLSDTDAMALESVMYVRGRPALRIVGEHLESLEHFPGSAIWQDFITDWEEHIVKVASATGAVTVDAFATGNPRWTQGTAWMAARDLVVTNRHVLLPKDGLNLIEPGTTALNARLRDGFQINVEFAADNRSPSASISRSVKSVLYVAGPDDPVDVAILEIEPNAAVKPLHLAKPAEVVPRYLYIVGHPALTALVPDDVRAVFGKPDGKKRVSFGQLLSNLPDTGTLLHDASTIGGYSGGPVVGISAGIVVGLHYYGDPAVGNFAASAKALQEHAAGQFLGSDQ
jgi:hypothetical protein